MTPKSAVTVSNMATILRPSANDLTAEVATQSKEFREKLNFEILMMILCNRLHHAGTNLEPVKTGNRPTKAFSQPLRLCQSQRDLALPDWNSRGAFVCARFGKSWTLNRQCRADVEK